MRAFLKKGLLWSGLVAVWFIGAAIGGSNYRPPDKPGPQGAPAPPAPTLRWPPPFQAQMLIRVTGAGKHQRDREMAITVGPTRLLIEPGKEGIAGLLIPADPRKERPAMVLKAPPAILRWAGDKPPFRFPLDGLFGGHPDEQRPHSWQFFQGEKGRKWEDDNLDGRKAKRTVFETPFRRVTLWMDAEMKVPLKVIRETKGRLRFKEEITLKNLKPITAESADKYIAEFLEGREEWLVEEWVAPDRVRRLLETEGVPVTAGPLPAKRVRMIHAGPRRMVRVFYGGKGIRNFFAVELTHGDVPAFSPETAHPPVFSGPAGRWKAKIWSNLPPEAAQQEVQAYIALLASLAP